MSVVSLAESQTQTLSSTIQMVETDIVVEVQAVDIDGVDTQSNINAEANTASQNQRDNTNSNDIDNDCSPIIVLTLEELVSPYIKKESLALQPPYIYPRPALQVQNAAAVADNSNEVTREPSESLSASESQVSNNEKDIDTAVSVAGGGAVARQQLQDTSDAVSAENTLTTVGDEQADIDLASEASVPDVLVEEQAATTEVEVLPEDEVLAAPADAATEAQAADTVDTISPRSILIKDVVDALELKTLRYRVNFAGKNAGELEIGFNRHGEYLDVISTSHLSTMASFFLDSYQISTTFMLTDDEVYVLRGETKTTDDNKVTQGFSIDYDNNKVLFNNGKIVPFSGHESFEADSFPLGLMTSEYNQIEGQEIFAVSGKRLSHYEYTMIDEETIDVDGQQFETYRVIRTKKGDPERKITFWLDRNNRLPIKIISTRKGIDTQLTIKT